MLKKHENTFENLHRLIDFVLASLIWLLSYYLRFASGIQGPAQTGLFDIFIKTSPIIGLLTLYFFNKEGLYLSKRFESRIKEISTVAKANTEANLAFIVILYFSGLDRISRLALFNYFILSSFLLISFRLALRNLLRILRKRGHNLRHFLLVGHGPQMFDYIQTVKRFKDSGITFIGWIDGHVDNNSQYEKIPKLQGEIDDIIEKYHPDAVILGYPNEEYHKLKKIIQRAHFHLTPIQILPDLGQAFLGHQISSFAGVPVITINHPQMRFINTLTKRLMDIFFSVCALLILSPLLLIIALAVKLTSKGPIFYGQTRMGLDGISFTMWKFRSMKLDAEVQTGAVWAVKSDPRRTPIGAFLRSTSLDELPQFWNVLRGDMSLVGPRPERPVFVEQFKNEIPAYMLRHKMKAGITGWAQVNGWRGDTSLEKRIECDMYYIKNWSLWFDFKILLMTLWTGLINKNAY